MMRPGSIRGRLTLWYVAALAVFLALVEGILFLNFRDSAIHGADDRLKEATSAVTRLLAHPEQDKDGEELSELLSGTALPSRPQEIAVAVFDRKGHRLRASPNGGDIPFVPAFDRETWSVQGPEETSRRILSVPAGKFIVEAALPWDPLEDSLERLGLLLVILFAAFLGLAGVGGWLLVGAALRPIEEITATANRIHADTLSERIPDHASDREIRGLVATLNAMIERLALAFESQRQFTANASHELRTPLTILQNETEIALSRSRSPEEYRHILSNVLEESKRMARLVNDLLFLARSDALPDSRDAVEVPLDDLCRLVHEEFQTQAHAKGLRLTLKEIAPGLSVTGDPERLRRLLENLVDNAIKYTPAPGEVFLFLYPHQSWAVVEVMDTGPGIAAEHLPRLFERFYRVDKSRSRALGGCGLGLAIAEQIARQHGGSLTVETVPGHGCRFIAWLPNLHPALEAGKMEMPPLNESVDKQPMKKG